MTDEAVPPRGNGVRRVVQACLVAQVMVAFLLAVDVWATRPEPVWAPQPDRPGDQRRPFLPGMAPEHPWAPGAPELPAHDATVFTITPQETEGEGARLFLSGPLAEGDAARLEDALDAAAPPVTVALHSPGGNVSEALVMGRMLREREVATLVPSGAACLSACPFVFAGGTDRRVEDEAWLGVHQSYFDRSAILPAFMAVSQIQNGHAQVLKYLDEMGIDPMVMVHALETPSNAIYLLSREQMERYGVLTDPPGDEATE